ncbi:MAG: nitroreductase family protein, partial [bacterium]
MEKTVDQKLIDLIRERRSITFFDPSKEVDNETLKEIIELASTAPSSYNLQPWKIAIIKSKENKKILKEICYNQDKVEDATANILILANVKGGPENVDKILEINTELGYIKSEQKESIKTSIINSW